MTVSTLAVLVLLGTGLMYLFQRQLSGAWFTFGVHPEVVGLLERSLEDQKALARLDPEQADRYRERFAGIQATVANLRVLRLNRDAIVNRYETLLLILLGGTLLLTAGTSILSVRRNEGRLQRLQLALTELSLGHTGIVTGERRRDTIGRIAAMIEQTSQRMARDRHRLASLRHLATWQEAARRQAHEMRTPLTAARLELARLQGLVESEAAQRLVAGVGQELIRLEQFARQFSSFARLARPRQERCDLATLLTEVCDLYAEAWPNLELRTTVSDRIEVMADAAMLRQVLVNLCENSSLALAERHGTVTFAVAATGSAPTDTVAIQVRDDGPGVDPSIRDRLLEPYTTTRQVGQGSGLGLAISRKIMLDHGGDLELSETSAEGTVFSLFLPCQEAGS